MTFLGIDVAKAQLEFACQPSGETGSMTKDDAGIRTSFILEVLHSHHAIEVPRGNGGLIQATHPVALSDPERNLARELASTRMSRAPRPRSSHSGEARHIRPRPRSKFRSIRRLHARASLQLVVTARLASLGDKAAIELF